MENAPVSSIEEVDDISSIDEYKVALSAGIPEKEALHLVEKYGRDNARTPFQWTGGPGAGFTEGTPWLHLNPNYKEINLEAQRQDPDSVFSFYKKLSALRKDPAYSDVLVYGDFIPYLEKGHNVMAYFRKTEAQTILVIANFQKESRELPLPGDIKQIVLSNLPLEPDDVTAEMISLKGYQVAVLELNRQN